jgi:mxaA protein
MRASRLAVLLLALSWACAAGAEEAGVVLEPLRRYGYVIGDQFELQAAVDVPAGYVLDADLLPKPGRVNAFLELRGIEPQQGVLQRIWSQGALRVALRFLVVNSGEEVRSEQTPALLLHFKRDRGTEFTARIPEVLFTVSPLTPAYVAGVAGLEELRPNVPAPRISARAEQVRLLVYALAALVLAGYLAWRQGWLPLRWLGKRPFARAAMEMRRLSRDAEPEAQAARARRLHRAFDEAAGFAVASHSLEAFFAAQPWSRAVEAEVREFFAGSDRFFYAGDAARMIVPERLSRLARVLAELEPRKVTAR